MKKFVKALLFSALAVTSFGMLSVFADDIKVEKVDEIPGEHLVSVSEAAENEIKILCIGNSILNHAPSESIGWYGSWGMAASCAENDYYHQLINLCYGMGFSTISWNQCGAYPLENAIQNTTANTYASEISSYLQPSLDKLHPDVVIFQMGENVKSNPGVKEYAHALKCFADACKASNPDVEIIFCTPFWGESSYKTQGVIEFAKESGYCYAHVAKLTLNENMALGQYEHSGVASHPSDTGMLAIANCIFDQLHPILQKRFLNSDKIGVVMDGQYVKFDVMPRVISDRTMIPVRAVAEKFGATVDWSEKKQLVTIKTRDYKIEMKIGQNTFIKSGVEYDLDVPAQVIDDRTMVPLRAIAEALDCDVSYNEETGNAVITTTK